ncbi:hypothetical protein TRIP_D170014 [uncultured Paludibacter sp.]|uniref:DNA helicase DnaB-like N-terminal domain-containing protein n=1 Tax=uncultured Paludibacter sp. TaxID=497635 RepID=A0A653A5Z6_9BACT|nr:hypothetical protein TRIP_D170014 [uncultured Paludibacter sp.]
MPKQRYISQPINYTIEGKEPPKNTDAEDYVLKCILENNYLIKDIYNQSSDIFYSEQNKAIFNSFKRLSDKSERINYITVQNELIPEEKQLFEIDITEYLLNLTANPETSSNFQNSVYHLVDVWTKRETLLTAYKVVQDIETKDAFDVLENYKNRLSEIETAVEGQNSYQKYIIDRTTAIDKPKPILFRGDDEILHLGDISMLEGQAGSRKTFLVSAMIAGFLSDTPEICLNFETNLKDAKVLLIDTEQAKGNTNLVAKRVQRMAGRDENKNYSDFIVLSLRELTSKERLQITLRAIESIQPTVVFIDNTKDLVSDFNNIEESAKVVSYLMKYSTKYNCSIVNVIHQNFGSQKARGHLGSMLYEKVDTDILLKADEVITEVDFGKTRNLRPSKFAFRINHFALPELTAFIEPTAKTNKLESVFSSILEPNKTYRHTDIVNMYVENQNRKPNTAKDRIKTALEEGVLIKNEVGLYHLKIKDNENNDLPF